MHGDNGKAGPKSHVKQRLIFFRGSIKKSSARVNTCIVFLADTDCRLNSGTQRCCVKRHLTDLSLKTNFLAKMERKIKNLELKKSGIFCFYLCEFLTAVSFVEPSSKFNLLCSFLVFAVNFGSGLSGLSKLPVHFPGQVFCLLYFSSFRVLAQPAVEAQLLARQADGFHHVIRGLIAERGNA